MHVSPDYHHRSKDAVARRSQTIRRAVLKCYDLHEPAHPLTDDTRSKALAALTDYAIGLTDDIAGFAILHECSASFCFLLVNTWRGNNEL